MIDAARQLKFKNIIRVCADNPFLMANSISNLIEAHRNGNAAYVSYMVDNNTPAILSHLGFYAELATLEAMEKIPELTDDPYYLEHVTNYIYTHPDSFQLHFIKAPVHIFNSPEIRLTVDTLEDFNLAQLLYSLKTENKWNHEELITFIHSRKDIQDSMKVAIKRNIK